MGGKLHDLHRNAKLNAWYEEVKACKQSGLTVNDWCDRNGISRSGFYYRYRKVMDALEARFDSIEGKEVCFAPMPGRSSVSYLPSSATILLCYGSLEVQIPPGADRASIHAIIEALKC
ncbi:MAG TPA: hypothetical protein VFC89_01145 [Oscillospiraceae bacterium]|nr:hypothetical protein [Oscillospiraceae bacterium]